MKTRRTIRSLFQRAPISILLFALLIAFALTAVALSPATGTGAEGPTSFTGSSSSAVVLSTNSGNGAAVEAGTGTVSGGSALVGTGTGGANKNTTSSNAVLGKVFGPTSSGVVGQAFNTDTAHPSIGVIGSSLSGNGMYAKTSLGTAAALFANNTAGGSTGVGIQAQSGGNTIIGTSTNVNGVMGRTNHVGADVTTGTAGVIGEDKGSNNFGVAGTTSTGFGVLGTASTSGVGVVGTSASNVGIYGASSNTHGIEGVTGSGIASNGSAGVIGIDNSTSGVTDVGVEGVSTNGNGVVGMTSSGVGPNNVAGVYGQDRATGCCNYAVWGDSTRGYGVYGTSTFSNGVVGSVAGTGDGVQGNSVGGNGVYGLSTRNTGVRAVSLATPYPSPSPMATGDGPPALFVDAAGGAPAIKVRGAGGTHLMSLDGAGNLRIAGNLFANSSTVGTPGNPLVVHRMPSGQTYGTYSTQQAVASLDDVGEARLVNGYAYVRIDPAFAAAIDRRSSYLVFVTPQADTQGWLYATQKSAAGFVVREHGGHSNIAFDYRIVAKPLDSDNRRLPVMNAQSPIQTFAPTNHTSGFLRPLIRSAAFSRNVSPSAASARPRQAIDPRMLRLLRRNAGYIPKPPAVPAIVRDSNRR